MKKYIPTLIATFLLTVLPVCAQQRFILESTPTAAISAIVNNHGLTLVGAVNTTSKKIYVVTAPETESVRTVLGDVGADPEVLDIEPDSLLAVPENPASLNQSAAVILDQLPPPSAVNYNGTPVLGAYLHQAAPAIIRLFDAQNAFGITGSGIVAIIDTGVDPNHSVLSNSLVPGYDFIHNAAGNGSELVDLTPNNLAALAQSTADPASKTDVALVNQSAAVILDQSAAVILDTKDLPAAFGHGTMVAGLVHLVAPTAKIMPLKAFKGDGTANLSDILRAIYYAVDHGANVINMSFSLITPSEELTEAIQYANDHNLICVASAGNTGNGFVANPASLNFVIGVASTSNKDTRSSFSSFGTGVFLAAPGEGLVTTYPGNNYAEAWGTSFSAPLVAGSSSLVIQVEDSSAGYGDASQALSHTKPLTPDLGNGRLDIFQTLQALIEASNSPN
jgi:hypothetical protein